jgi:integrase
VFTRKEDVAFSYSLNADKFGELSRICPFQAKRTPFLFWNGPYGSAYVDQSFVFAKAERHPGYPILIKTVENRMARLLKLAGLNETLTPHSLRHTHTSLLAEAEVVLEDIMERLGHTEDDTTRIIYRHVTKEMKKKASHKFGQLMRSLLLLAKC